MVSVNTCDLSDLIIRQSLALPLVQTGNAGWVPFLESQLSWVHATFLWYSWVSAIASSPCRSVWLYMAADNWLLTLCCTRRGYKDKNKWMKVIKQQQVKRNQDFSVLCRTYISPASCIGPHSPWSCSNLQCEESSYAWSQQFHWNIVCFLNLTHVANCKGWLLCSTQL